MSIRTDLLPVPFVGREAELRQLQNYLSSVISARRPQVVLVQGDLGVGKTSLVEHFLSAIQRQAEQDHAPLIGRAKCALESGSSGLIPFSQLLNSLMTDSEQRHIRPEGGVPFLSETAPAWLDILSLGASRRMPATGDKTTEAAAGAVDHVAVSAAGAGRSGGVDVRAESVQVGGDAVGRDKITANITNIYGQSRDSYTQDQVFIQFTNVLNRLAETQIVVAFIDDLQLADASSLRLLFHLSRNLHDGPILFICTCGPVVALSANPNADLFREICAELVHRGAGTVDILAGLDVAQYAARRYSPNSFSSDFVARVQKLTDGHAQFVSELFSMWEKAEVIAPAPSLAGPPVWTMMRDPDFPNIPTSLKPLLDLRIDALAKELQEVLNLASVEGTDFAAEVVAKLRSADELETYGQLEVLERDYRFIQVEDDPELAAMSLSFYRFVNRFFRELVYSRLNLPRQRALHKKVAECLKILYTDQRPIAGQLADHFHKANDILEAVRYALMAARFEQSRYAWYEAEARCRTGLEWLKSAGSTGPGGEAQQLQLDLLECSAHGLYCSGEYARAEERYAAALTMAAGLRVEPNRLANLYYQLGDGYYYEGRTQPAIQACQAGKQVLLSNNIPLNALHINLDALAAFLQSQLGQSEAAAASIRGILDQAGQLARNDDLEEACGNAFNMLGVVLAELGRYPESQAAYTQALEIAEKIGSQPLAGMVVLNLADNFLLMGLTDQAALHAERALRLAQRIGDVDGIETAQATQGEILLALGKPREAVEQLSQAVHRARDRGSAWNRPYLCAALTRTYLAINDVDSARQYALQGAASAQDGGQFEWGLALDALGQVETAAGEWTMAEQHFNEAMAIHRRANHRHALARAQRHYADLLLGQSRKLEAAEVLRAALAAFQELGLPDEAARTQQLLATLAAA